TSRRASSTYGRRPARPRGSSSLPRSSSSSRPSGGRGGMETRLAARDRPASEDRAPEHVGGPAVGPDPEVDASRPQPDRATEALAPAVESPDLSQRHDE